MNYYIDVTLMNSSDFSPYELWSRLYTQLHLALVEVKDQNDQVNIGVAFPEYRFTHKQRIGFLGTKLRLFAQTEDALKALNLGRWLDRLTDYVHITSIREVPQDKITGYAFFSRKQVKSNPERLARRRAARGDIDFEEALQQYQNFASLTDLPYIQMKSLTSDKSFKLFIQKHHADKSAKQVYSTYGLSSESSVPEF